MLKSLMAVLCFQLAVFLLMADNAGQLQPFLKSAPTDSNLPPPPVVPSYQEMLSTASYSMLEIKKSIMANADKKDQKALMLSNICADSLQKIIDKINFLMNEQKAYAPNKYCDSIFEPDQCNIWSSEDCARLAEKTRNLSEEMKNKARDAELGGKTAEADSYNTASKVAADVAITYKELAQEHDDFSRAIDNFSNYVTSRKQTKTGN